MTLTGLRVLKSGGASFLRSTPFSIKNNLSTARRAQNVCPMAKYQRPNGSRWRLVIGMP